MENLVQQSFCLIYSISNIKNSKRRKKEKNKNLFQITLEEYVRINGDYTKYLINQYQNEGDKDILDTIIKENFKLIHYTINYYNINVVTKDIEYDDLVQEGYIGLIKAINNFDVTKKTLFSTYATNYIKGYIYNYIKLNGNGSLSISLHGMNLLNKYKKDDNHIKDPKLKLSLKTIAKTPISLDTPLNNDDSSDDNNLQDILSDNQNVFSNIDFQMVWEKISLDLTKIEKEVIEYYIQGEKWTAISKKLNLEKYTVRSSGLRGLSKLKNKYGENLKKLLT